MLRRLIIVSLLLAAILAPSALAATVKIRIEGKTQTIFGASQPRVTAAVRSTPSTLTSRPIVTL